MTRKIKDEIIRVARVGENDVAFVTRMKIEKLKPAPKLTDEERIALSQKKISSPDDFDPIMTRAEPTTPEYIAAKAKQDEIYKHYQYLSSDDMRNGGKNLGEVAVWFSKEYRNDEEVQALFNITQLKKGMFGYGIRTLSNHPSSIAHCGGGGTTIFMFKDIVGLRREIDEFKISLVRDVELTMEITDDNRKEMGRFEREINSRINGPDV